MLGTGSCGPNYNSYILDGFRKVTHVEQGGLKVEKDDMEFAHQYFIRGQEHLLEHIKRKVKCYTQLFVEPKYNSTVIKMYLSTGWPVLKKHTEEYNLPYTLHLIDIMSHMIKITFFS